MPSKANHIAAVVRARLCWYASRGKGRRCAVALSGGVDSCAVLAAFLEVGAEPIIISYTPATHDSTDFKMARQTADNLGLDFWPMYVPMDADVLDTYARKVIGLGYTSKVQVESLTPMAFIAEMALDAGVHYLLTGDQSDGYFALSRWAAHNYDRAQGVPFRERSRNVKADTTPARIDAIRKRYYELDLSCSAAVASICEQQGVKAVFPFRDQDIREAFTGSVWSEVNRPRIKEPIRQAFDEWFTDDQILVRPTQVNLHKGDSRFGDTLSKTMMSTYPGYATPRGLYGAIYRGEVG